ncbi:hypothetical protein ACFYS8_09535 [Kitasatospora sp. NPDC004615]|uniref:hypothetical protein n=1 Tax=Kitasatospora sp. NPDC004615 TaxID=3364017 RepID=UPI0036C8E25D
MARSATRADRGPVGAMGMFAEPVGYAGDDAFEALLALSGRDPHWAVRPAV